MMQRGELPTYGQLMWLTVLALRRLGGRASSDEIAGVVADIAQLDEEKISRKRNPDDRISFYLFRLGWARTYLKGAGAVANPTPGVWVLTPFGTTATEEEVAAAHETDREAKSDRRRRLANARTSGGSPRPIQTEDIHRRVLAALDGSVLQPRDDQKLSQKPLDLMLRPPLIPRVRLYAFAARPDEKGRKTTSFRVQLTIGEPGGMARFDSSDGFHPVLLGLVEDLNVFVLWDATMQESGGGFRYSKSCYVNLETVLAAAASGLAIEERLLRSPTREERIVAARVDRLPAALVERWNRSVDSLVEI